MADEKEPAHEPDRAPATLSQVLGEVVFLMTMPQSHKFLFLADLEWLVMPPLGLRQFRLWRQGQQPVAFASWAFLSDEAQERAVAGVRRLRPSDWKSGDHAWLMDVVAPNAEFAQKMVEELKRDVFAGRTLKGLRPRPQGGGSEVVDL
ncbi:MAG: toxin-activating lysine-acyltransferase [Solirubrobacterales bacterium]